MFTITPEDFPPKHKKWIHPGANSLRTDDIEGARSYLPGYKYINKPNFYNVNDIEKAQAHPRHSSTKESYSLKTSDISNASPSAVLFKTNRLGHNPLTPVYILPSYETKPGTPPRFIRDSISVDDIEGSRPQIYSKWQTRNSIGVHDILGATAWKKKELVKPNLMDCKDINSIEVFTSSRTVNPLMPEYMCRDEDNKVVIRGHVEGSSPKVLVRMSQSPHDRHLNTKDIEGATAGTVGVGPIGTKLRNYIRSPTDTQDIEGAQTGTFKKGITTVRATNPLDPKYTWLTEEASDEVKPAAQTLPNDKFFKKNQAKFWGATPALSESPSKSSSSVSTPANHEYLRNAKKFYGHDSATPNTLQVEFKKNAEGFFASTGRAPLVSYLPKGSIHKQKEFQKVVDVESMSYQKNAKEFFDAHSRPSASRQSESVDPEFRYASEKSSRRTPLSPRDRASVRSSEQDYKFSLSRAEIAQPAIDINASFRKSNSNAESARGKLGEAGKQFISS